MRHSKESVMEKLFFFFRSLKNTQHSERVIWFTSPGFVDNQTPLRDTYMVRWNRWRWCSKDRGQQIWRKNNSFSGRKVKTLGLERYDETCNKVFALSADSEIQFHWFLRKQNLISGVMFTKWAYVYNTMLHIYEWEIISTTCYVRLTNIKWPCLKIYPQIYI